MSYPSVSVVITAYDRPDYLKMSIKSVIDQTYPIKEIIVVDDCSPSDLETVVKSYNEPRMIFRRSMKNSGANHARNVGIRVASSNFVAFLDDDDIWLENKISTQIEAMNENNVKICLCSYDYIGKCRIRNKFYQGIIEEKQLKKGNPFCGASGLIASRKSLENINFDETLPCGQDWDIFVRLIQEEKIYYIDKPLFKYRRDNHNGITLKARNISIEDYSPRLLAIKKHKSWLGNKNYRMKLSNQILAYAHFKSKPLDWVKFSIRETGYIATCAVIAGKLYDSFKQKNS